MQYDNKDNNYVLNLSNINYIKENNKGIINDNSTDISKNKDIINNNYNSNKEELKTKNIKKLLKKISNTNTSKESNLDSLNNNILNDFNCNTTEKDIAISNVSKDKINVYLLEYYKIFKEYDLKFVNLRSILNEYKELIKSKINENKDINLFNNKMQNYNTIDYIEFEEILDLITDIITELSEVTNDSCKIYDIKYY